MALPRLQRYCARGAGLSGALRVSGGDEQRQCLALQCLALHMAAALLSLGHGREPIVSEARALASELRPAPWWPAVAAHAALDDCPPRVSAREAELRMHCRAQCAWILITSKSGPHPNSCIIAFMPNPLEASSDMAISSASPDDVAIVGCVVDQVLTGWIPANITPPDVDRRVLRLPAQ